MEANELEKVMYNLNVLCSSSPINIAECSDLLKTLSLLYKNDRKRQIVSSAQWHTLLKALAFASSFLKKRIISDAELDFVIDVLRCLRNCCAGCYRDDQLTISSEDLLQVVMDILLSLLKSRNPSTEKEFIALRCCLQLFGNMVCQSNSSKTFVWRSFQEEGLFASLLGSKDAKVREYTMMVLYNCMALHQMLNTNEGHKVLITLTDSLCEDIIDWGLLVVEALVNSEDFMDKGYVALPIQNRLLVLDVIAEQLESMENSNILEAMLPFLKQHFIDYVLDIVKTCESNSGDLKSLEITKLLNILCAVSVAPRSGHILKGYGDLIEVAIEILKSVHLLGKKSCNAFSAVPSLKDVHNLSKKDIEVHPSYGFKRNLIRLIGNMCSGCKQNQDLVRKLDGIPLLLDCCNLDMRNPYIMQWCILAVRNILENNVDNQAVLASISVTGEMVNSPLLRELGIKVEVENGRPILKPASASS